MTKTGWTYDRIIVTDATLYEYVEGTRAAFYFDAEYGLSGDIVEVSDNYPIFAVFRVDLMDDD